MRIFENQVVVITGASSGIGEALAREFARNGAKLVLAARRTDRLEALAAELSRSGTEAISIRCDVTVDGDPEKMMAGAVARFGRVDCVIANAGFGVVGKAPELKLADYRRQFETNVFGLLRTFYASLGELKKSRGRLVLMGSVSGHISLPQSSPYSMSKFCVRAFAEAATAELKSEGVSLVLLSPGFVRSEIRRVDNSGKFLESSKDPLPDWLPMATPVAARKMVRAIARRKREEIITTHGKVFVLIQRFFPCLLQWLKERGVAGRGEPERS